MSYILDALNKSEEEKKQHRTPGLNTIHQKPKNRTPGKRLWMIVASAVVILNLLGLIIWFVFLAETPKTTTAKIDPLPTTQPVIGQTPPNNNRALSREPRTARPEPALIGSTPSRPVRERPAAQPDPFQASLSRQVKQEISAIRFSSHIFANDASLRMVVINGQSLREGNRFGSGLLLKNITEEGVVVAYQNNEVPISVLSQWADD